MAEARSRHSAGWVLAAALLAASPGGASGDAKSERHLIYLHGAIVQQEQNARPRHPEFGFYEFDEILHQLRQRGFVVHGEIRPRAQSVGAAADRVVAQVKSLLASGVPADHVTVVGASMGAAIALRASARLGDPELRFALLGVCLPESVRRLAESDGGRPSGRLLAVREASDETTTPCAPWKGDDPRPPALVAREIVLDTGLRHGFLYRPLPAWVTPVTEWAK
jgi:pimeloyl-ACP methyl ester carboxylesterase